jgi:carbon monoxide dehydrogenase subunit G
MTALEVSIEIDATPEQVWEVVKVVGDHVDWMADAESITFTSEQESGEGTTFDCLTKVGPIRLTDKMTITEWVDNEVMGVRHEGLVTGTGRFTLSPVGDSATRFVWAEDLTFPWWLGGPVGGVVGRKVLEYIWNANLARLRDIVHASVAS